MFSNSRDDPPDIGIIMPKVGSAASWAFCVVWFSYLSGGPGGGGGSSSWVAWVVGGLGGFAVEVAS